MIARAGTFKSMKIGMMMKDPETLAREVSRLKFILDKQLEEEFLRVVSFGIQQVIEDFQIANISDSASQNDG